MEGKKHAFISIFSLIFCLLASGLAFGMPAYPGPVMEQQPNGFTIELRIRGDEHFNWMEDANGYTVVLNSGWYQYATLDASGHLTASGLNVGLADPAANGLAAGILPSQTVRSQNSKALAPQPAVPPIGTVKNLVILVRFSNHGPRTMPTEANIDVLMNATSPDPTYAPTGSVKRRLS